MWKPFPILIDLDDMNSSADPCTHSRQQTHLALDELAILLLRLEVSQPDKLMRVTNATDGRATRAEGNTHASPPFSSPLLRLTEAMSSKCLFPGSYTLWFVFCGPCVGLGMVVGG